jgi:hypothetical protein
MLLLATSGAAAQGVLIDKSEIRFVSKQMGVNVEGRFRKWKASVDWKPDDLARYLAFRDAGDAVTPRQLFQERADNWLILNDHNHLRITRILKCLTLCGLAEYAAAFHDTLLQVAKPGDLSPQTLRFWRNAVQ